MRLIENKSSEEKEKSVNIDGIYVIIFLKRKKRTKGVNREAFPKKKKTSICSQKIEILLKKKSFQKASTFCGTTKSCLKSSVFSGKRKKDF